MAQGPCLQPQRNNRHIADQVEDIGSDLIWQSKCTKVFCIIQHSYNVGVCIVGQCKKDVTSMLTHWSCVFLALTHRSGTNNWNYILLNYVLSTFKGTHDPYNNKALFLLEMNKCYLLIDPIAGNINIYIFSVRPAWWRKYEYFQINMIWYKRK